MFSIFKGYLNLVYKHCPKLFILLIIFSPLVAILQTAGIVSIYPIITVVTNPEYIIENTYFQRFYPLEFSTANQLTLQMVIFFVLCNITALALFFCMLILNRYITDKTVLEFKAELLKKIINKNNFQKTISNKSNILAVVENEVSKMLLVIETLLSIFQNISMLFIFLLTSVYIEKTVIIIALLIGGIYLLVFYLFKKKINKISFDEVVAGQEGVKYQIYINLGLKDLHALKVSDIFLKKLKNIWIKKFKLSINKSLYLYSPRYLFEMVLYIMIGIFVVNYLNQNFIIKNLPSLVVLFIFLWKSIPIFFNFFRQASNLLSNKDSYYKIMHILHLFSNNNDKIKSNFSKKFNNFIKLKNVCFSYDQQKKFIFNLNIKKKQKILITGKSGSGKSTLLNILTGLISNFSGSIVIDNKSFTDKNYNTKLFGYVVQQPFLFAGTVYENISLKKIKKINSFEKNKLQKIYETCGLENIVNNFNDIFTKKIELDSPDLSGGQKQRISIARVLYSKPDILILDEATNAMDRKSEIKLFNKIFENFPYLTFILVTHRNTHVKFNQILSIEQSKENNFILNKSF